MPTALISVSDKTGLAEFAKELRNAHDYKIIATGSTAKYLTEKGVDCVTVDSVTAFPEILGGRVKTLHPRIFAGILARELEEDKKSLEDLGINTIELVVCNLYPFEKKLQEGLKEDEMIEQIDVGGPSMIRAAAKNFARVAVACDPSQYEAILKSIKGNKGVVERALRKTLAREAFERTMRYDTAISAYFAAIEKPSGNGGESVAQSSLPSRMSVSLSQYQKLRYGENPHQSAIWYSAQPQEQTPAEPITFPPFETLQGKELSSNNIVDTYALVRILRELQPPATCIIKHNNPCGVAIASTLKESYEKAYNTDPLSAFGGIFGFTGEVDEELAGLATGGFIEIIAAPAFTDGALALLSKKKNVRVLVFKPGLLSRAGQQWQARDLQDFGWIFEKDEEPPAHADGFDCKSGTLPANLKADVGFAWGVVRHLTSNAIFIAKDGVSRGFGIGQTSRIASVNIALAQAGVHAKGAVMASDAFFPATDNIEAAARAGISVIVQPGGSIKDDEVIKACKDNNITMLFTGQRCFKH